MGLAIQTHTLTHTPTLTPSPSTVCVCVCVAFFRTKLVFGQLTKKNNKGTVRAEALILFKGE